MFIKKELDYSILWQFNVTQKREVTKEEVGMKIVFRTFFRLKFSKAHLGGDEYLNIAVCYRPKPWLESQISMIYDKLTVGFTSRKVTKVNQTSVLKK